MKIGNPATFAVVFELDPSPSPWLFGKFSFVLANSVVGNYEEGCSIRTAVGSLREILTYTGARSPDADLMGSSAEEAFNRINNALYIDSGQSDDQVEADKSFYWRFQVKPIGLDVFDGWKCYLIEDNAHGRLIWRNEKNDDVPRERLLDAGEFDRVITEFITYVETEYGHIMRGGGNRGISD